MRPSENVKSSYGTKATPKVEQGSLMRLPVKKTYCGKCQKLVKGQTQSSASAPQITCPKCGQQLWNWKSTLWRSARNGADDSR